MNGIISKRPAESATSAAGAVVALVVWLAHIKDPAVVAPLVVVVSNVPAAVTWCVRTFRRKDRGV